MVNGYGFLLSYDVKYNYSFILVVFAFSIPRVNSAFIIN